VWWWVESRMRREGGAVRDDVINKWNKDQKSNVGWNIVVNMPNTYPHSRDPLTAWQHNPGIKPQETVYRPLYQVYREWSLRESICISIERILSTNSMSLCWASIKYTGYNIRQTRWYSTTFIWYETDRIENEEITGKPRHKYSKVTLEASYQKLCRDIQTESTVIS
jgi:hypothetical protein